MKKRVMSILLALYVVFSALSANMWAAAQNSAEMTELTSLCVTNSDGEMVSLLDDHVSVSLGKEYSFSAAFSDADQVSDVYIVSTKGDQIKRLKAQWDGSAFVTSGAFDGDESYVPGKIHVEYTKKVKNVKVGDSVDWRTLQATLGDYCIATVDSASGEAAQVTVDISKLLGSKAEAAFSVAVDVFDEASGGDLAEWLGYYRDLEAIQKRILEGGRYYLYLDDTHLDTYVTMIIRDVSKSRYTKLVLKEMGEHFDSWKNVAEDLEGIKFISGFVYNALAIQENADKLREEIAANPSISESMKFKLNAEVDAYENDRVYFVLLSSVLPAVVAATGGTLAGPAIALNALIGVINAAAETFWDYRIGMLRGCELLDTSFTGVGGCGVPLTRDYLIDNAITESGRYCLPEGAIGVNVGCDDGGPVDVTLCLHGEHILSSINVADGSTLELCDCMYTENMDGSITGGEVETIRIGNGSSVTVSSGIVGNSRYRNCLSSNGGEILITGGTITESIGATNDSRIHVTNGKILGGISSADGGTITISGGNVLGTAYNFGCSIHTDSGTIIINEGQIAQGVWTDSGSVYMYNGLVERKNTTIDRCIVNNTGRVEIYGDTVLGGVCNGETGTVYISGGKVICARQESDKAAGDYSAIKNTGGHVIISGGLIQGEGKGSRQSGTRCIENSAGGIVKISNGIFYSSEGICIDNGGELSITGGKFCSFDTTIYGHSKVTIDDGMFRSLDGTCLHNGWGTMNITDGTFIGAQYAVQNADGQLNISGGQFFGNGGVRSLQGNTNYWPVVTITGGVFQANEFAIYTIGGEAIISDGVFQAMGDGRRNAAVIVGDGKFSINGGMFLHREGSVVDVLSGGNGTLIISGGYFEGVYGLDGEKERITLRIDQDSSIEINTSAIAFPGIDWEGMWRCEAGEGYVGGVAYYSSAEAIGSMMSFEDVNARKYYGPYARLTAGPAPGDFSASCAHSYRTMATLPTCIKRGYTTHICDKCGYTYTSNYVPAYGHSFDRWTTETKPTQTTVGVQCRECAACGGIEYRYINKSFLLSTDVSFTRVNQTDTSETVTLENRSKSTLLAQPMLAVYDEQGRMIGCYAVREEIPPGKMIDLTVKYPSTDSAAFTRVFLVDPVSLCPLCAAANIE